MNAGTLVSPRHPTTLPEAAGDASNESLPPF
jgi:hypothetical protein